MYVCKSLCVCVCMCVCTCVCMYALCANCIACTSSMMYLYISDVWDISHTWTSDYVCKSLCVCVCVCTCVCMYAR